MRWPSRVRAPRGRAADAIAGTAAAVLLVLAAAPAIVLAATPTPDPMGDPRSAGQGPGLVGDPALAILAVVAIALLAVTLTLAYVRATGGREGRPDS